MAFPNVPDVPGVPPIPRDPAAAVAAISLLTGDSASGLAGSLTPQWGLYRNGAPVITADSVISFDFKQDWAIADYQLEPGPIAAGTPPQPQAFESYDKVQQPFTVRMRFAQGGDKAERQALLDSADAAANSMDLYDAVTPEKTYPSVSISHYDYRRTAGAGLGLIVVDLWANQVRANATAAFSSTKSPTAAATTQGGVASTTSPTPAEAKAVADTPDGAGF